VTRPRRTPPVPAHWWPDVLLALGFAALTAALVWVPALLRLDLAVRDWCDAHRPPPVHLLMLGLDHLGQGTPVMVAVLLLAIVLAWRQRRVRVVVPAVLAAAFTTVALQVLKRWTSRGAPHHGPVRLFAGSSAVEYPSGHVTNGVVYYTAVAVLLAPYAPLLVTRLLRWLPGPLVVVGTTYLSYHWLTDSIGGLLLGFLLARLLLRVTRWADRPPPAADQSVA
jgi:membrane-associated phospholipid phosphatase